MLPSKCRVIPRGILSSRKLTSLISSPCHKCQPHDHSELNSNYFESITSSVQFVRSYSVESVKTSPSAVLESVNQLPRTVKAKKNVSKRTKKSERRSFGVDNNTLFIDQALSSEIQNELEKFVKHSTGDKFNKQELEGVFKYLIELKDKKKVTFNEDMEHDKSVGEKIAPSKEELRQLSKATSYKDVKDIFSIKPAKVPRRLYGLTQQLANDLFDKIPQKEFIRFFLEAMESGMCLQESLIKNQSFEKGLFYSKETIAIYLLGKRTNSAELTNRFISRTPSKSRLDVPSFLHAPMDAEQLQILCFQFPKDLLVKSIYQVSHFGSYLQTSRVFTYKMIALLQTKIQTMKYLSGGLEACSNHDINEAFNFSMGDVLSGDAYRRYFRSFKDNQKIDMKQIFEFFTSTDEYYCSKFKVSSLKYSILFKRLLHIHFLEYYLNQNRIEGEHKDMAYLIYTKLYQSGNIPILETLGITSFILSGKVSSQISPKEAKEIEEIALDFNYLVSPALYERTTELQTDYTKKMSCHKLTPIYEFILNPKTTKISLKQALELFTLFSFEPKRNAEFFWYATNEIVLQFLKFFISHYSEDPKLFEQFLEELAESRIMTVNQIDEAMANALNELILNTLNVKNAETLKTGIENDNDSTTGLILTLGEKKVFSDSIITFLLQNKIRIKKALKPRTYVDIILSLTETDKFTEAFELFKIYFQNRPNSHYDPRLVTLARNVNWSLPADYGYVTEETKKNKSKIKTAKPKKLEESKPTISQKQSDYDPYAIKLFDFDSLDSKKN